MEQKVTDVAEQQHGVVTRAQVLDFGLTGRQINHLLSTGELVGMSRAVYRIPGAPTTWEQRVMAAWLAAAGPTHVAAVAGRTAAALHGFAGFTRDGTPVLCMPRNGSPRNRLATVVTCTDLRPGDCVTLEPSGLLLTNSTRTVLDLALGTRRPQQLNRLLDRAVLDAHTTVAELWEVFLHVADRGKSGVAQLRIALQERSGAYIPLESELEHLAVEALAHTRLAPATRQHPLPGAPFGRVDLAYTDARLVIELDGAQHRLPEHRRADYERDVAAARVGWMVLRFDWSHLRFRSTWFAASVAAVHAQRLSVAGTAA
jgi:very-short-patch-repair endonuclease